MAITKENILTQVNSRTARAETDIDSLIRAVLLDLTIDFPFLQGEFTTDTIAGQHNYTLGEVTINGKTIFLRKVTKVKVDDKGPLELINTWQEYQALIAEETSSDRKEPNRYIIYNGVLYVYPAPDTTYTLTLFASYIEMDAASIGLPDIFIEVLIEGVCFKLLESKGMGNTPQAIVHKGLYDEAVGKIMKVYSVVGTRVEYHDI